ncbi:Neutral/alkaline nonlysosomal ceramidase [Globomyces pollinis-pini]|nr:Neutral/alkaline nonlysosomal ceramidase [Globomyces pollinis-pini]
MILSLGFLLTLLVAAPLNQTPIRGGVGRADITGPFGEIAMQGYAELDQFANGLHLRLSARAVILGDKQNRIVYISIDSLAPTRFAILNAIKKVNNPLYTEQNVMVSATHTHSGPGGAMEHFLYHATNFGKIEEERTALADGIAAAIQMAHNDFESNQGVDISIHKGKVNNSSRNRSPQSYMANPESERLKYEDGNTDKTLTLLSLKNSNSTNPKAVFNWLAVHGTSMRNNNQYVSGDNKGFASYLWEQQQREAGNPNFVAAFSQSNSGDVTPNTNAPVCSDTGKECDGGWGSCPDSKGVPHNLKCFARGPGGNDDFLSTKLIGTASVNTAQQIIKDQGEVLTGTVQSRHVFVDMSEVYVDFNGKKVKTCKTAVGQPFAAGTTDGPGLDNVFQGLGPVVPGLNVIAHLASYITSEGKPASQEIKDCHHPKTVLLATGEMSFPYTFQPHVLPLQIFLIGRKFVIIAVPAEITTMSGRRLREGVKVQLIQDDTVDEDVTVVIAGLANAYSSYVTTYEEYQLQRYEGGSTIFGPHTLQAYIDQFKKLAQTFKKDVPPLQSARPTTPGDYNEISLNNQLVHPILFDDTPLKMKTWDWKCACLRPNFGTLLQNAPATAKSKDTVMARFQCAHPRNHPTNKPHMTVEQKQPDGSWKLFLDDGSWDTKYLWKRTELALSECEVSWSIGETTKVPSGTYRLRLFGTYKDGNPINNILFEGFEGASGEIQVTV